MHEGEGVFLVEDESELLDLLSVLTEQQPRDRPAAAGFVTQDLVACHGNVLRVVLLGNSLRSYWKRPPATGRGITSLSRGARIDHAWRPDLQVAGRKATARLAGSGRLNLAALDMVFDLDQNDPQPFSLEINYYFGRRGLGGSLALYRQLYQEVKNWLKGLGLDAKAVKLF